MNKAQRELAQENALAYRNYLDKAILYAECTNMAVGKYIIEIEPLYDKMLQANKLVLKGVEDE